MTKVLVQFEEDREMLEKGDAFIRIGAFNLARHYAKASAEYASKKMLRCEWDEVLEWFQNEDHLIVLAVRLSVDKEMDLDYMLKHQALISPLFRMSQQRIGKNVRGVLRKYLRKSGRPVSELLGCKRASDLAGKGIPYVLPGGRVAKLDTLGFEEVERAVWCVRNDDVQPHDHLPLDGKAATDGLTGRFLRIEEVLERGKLVSKFVVRVPMMGRDVFVPVKAGVSLLRKEGMV